MTSPDDPRDGDPGNGGKATGDGNRDDEQQDELNLAYLPPHARAYYANADERIQNALAHVNPARAVSFLRKTHGPHAGQEALMRALMAERQHHRTAARYWLDVYEKMMSG
jgi:ABC-type proline/glycine betaine transport system substrate-binding protein